jgi:hypothetical protein
MFDPDANMPRYRLWNGVPDIRNRQQIAEQSVTFHSLSWFDEGFRAMPDLVLP